MLIHTFLLILPLFAVIVAGYILGRLFHLSEESLIRVLTDFFMPLLIFVSLYNSDITLADMTRLFGATTLMVALLLGVALLYARLAHIDPRGFSMPIVFMNSGFLGIPLMQLWGGNEAMNIIIIFDEIQTLYIFTLGFLIIRGGINREAVKASLTSPILWAVVLGFGANILGIPVPGAILETCRFAGDAAPPLAAFVLGVSLHARKPQADIHLIAGLLLRTLAGFCFALLIVFLFRFEGLMKTVILVTGALPAAVFSYVLPARYGIESGRAQGIVIISTILGIITIPAAFAIAAGI
jgi:predicted permease